MKKYGLLNIGLFITSLVVAQASGQVGFWPIESFRLQATGTIEDDLDWALDPVDIQRVEGYRIYTSLSNLITYAETPLGDSTANQYLLGFSGPLIRNLPGFKSTLLIEKDKLNLPNDVQLVLPGGFVEGKGFVEASWKRWIPPDYKSYELWEKSARDEFSTEGHVYLMNNSFHIGYLTVGISSPFLSRSYRYTTAATDFRYAYRIINQGEDSFEESYKYYDDEQNKDIIKTHDKGDFSTLYGVAEAPWELSIASPFGLFGLEMQGRLKITPFKSKYEISDNFSAVHDSSVGQVIMSYFDEGEHISVDQKEDGKIFSISGVVRRDFMEKRKEGYIEAEIGGGYLSGNADSVFKDNFDRTRKYGPDTLLAIWTYNYNDLTEYSGNLSGFLFNTETKGVFPVGDNMLLGTHVNISYQKIKREGDIREDDNQNRTFDDGDEQPDDQDDYVTEVTIIEEEDATREEKVWTYRLPIGLEYRFTKNRNWAFRVGAIPSFKSISTEDVVKVTNPKVTTIITPRGDGSSDTTIIKDPFFPEQRQETDEFTQETNYTYGLGWYPTKNLQVDLLAFLRGEDSILDLSTYQNLRLSISLKF